MGKRIIQTAAAFGAAAGLLVLLFFAVKTKRLQINRWIVSDTDHVGVDISEYQADVDMDTLREQGITFIYMKATEGSGHVDGRFAQNWKNAQESGIPAGAYHFFSFDSDGKIQAQHFIDVVGDLNGDLIPAVDVEWYGDKEKNPPEKEEVVESLRRFVELIEKEYGVKPLIYASGDVYDRYIKGEFDDCLRWVRSVYYPVSWDADDNWVIWQYSDRGIMDGYSGGEQYIDLNVLNTKFSLEDLTIRQ
jgi:lysozyme